MKLKNLSSLSSHMSRTIFHFVFAVSLAFSLASGLSGCLPTETPQTSAGASSDPTSTFGITSATTVSGSKVKITWPKSSDPNTYAYNIYESSLSSWKLMKTILASTNKTEITLTNLTPQNLYNFSVRVVDKKGKEDDNNKQMSAIPYDGVTAANVLNSSSATLTYADASNAEKVRIYCHTDLSPLDSQMEETEDVKLKQHTLLGLKGGTAYYCRVALVVDEFEDNNSNYVKFTPVGSASKVEFLTQPSGAVAGKAFAAQPVVRLLDVTGSLVTGGADATALVTLTISNHSPTNGTLEVKGATPNDPPLTTVAVNAVGGIATFSNVFFPEVGAKIIMATKEDTTTNPIGNGSIALTADSNQFTVTPDSVSATKSTITLDQVGPIAADGVASYVVTVTLKDQYGNPIPGIKPQFTSSISGDTLVQPSLVTDANGQSSGSITTTIADLARKLSISSPNITLNIGETIPSVTAPFSAGQATKLIFTAQPANAGAGMTMQTVKVAIADAYGNVVTTGPAASSAISMSIYNNVSNATLGGTTPVAAVAGVASFTNLSVSKTGSGYKLQAFSGTYAQAYSNSFNITAGTPYKVIVSGPATVSSGSCSTAVTVQLQDSGSNPANASVFTQLAISGLGSGSLYTSSSCSGSPAPAPSFTAGTSTKTYYFKDLKAEALTVSVTDPSNVLQSGSLSLKNNPDKIALSIASSSVVAGKCSSALTITPQGDNGSPGPLFVATNVSLTGVVGTNAQVFTDASCTQGVSATAITLPITSGANYSTTVYIKDSKAETLSLNVSDASGGMTTVSSLQTVQVLASNLLFAGPASVVSGACSTAFTVTLKDALGNSVTAPANTTLNISGLQGSTTGNFYMNSACSGAPTSTTITIPQNSSYVQIFFQDSTAEALNIKFTDPSLQLADSNALAIGISPSAFRITANGNITSAKTTECAGPFTIATLDGAGNVTAAITSITANLSGAGTSGAFYSDSSCSQAVTSYGFAQGDQQKTFYFMGQYPANNLNLKVTDAGGILTQGTYTFTIKAAPGFIGTVTASMMDAAGNLSHWFVKGQTMVASRFDGAQSIRHVHFSTDPNNPKQYLYVADMNQGRILKYDYQNRKYVGWIGAVWGDNGWNYVQGMRPTGSTLMNPDAATCIGTAFGQQTPGWCLGGMSYRINPATYGSFNQVMKVVDDGNGYIYVVDRSAYAVMRYKADTGEFAGWIGTVQNTPVANPAITGLSAACTSTTNGQGTPGWCYGGYNRSPPNGASGADSSMNDPRSLAYANGYLYVGTYGSIKKFDASTGQYLGWIGMVASTPTGGAAGCTAKTNGQITPGWCMGGTFQNANMRYSPGGINYPTDLQVIGNTLYVLGTDSGGEIFKYDLVSGAFLGLLPNLNYGWTSPQSMVSDGTYLYVADYSRLIRVDPSTGTVTGWVGKVNGTPTSDVTGAIPGCTTLAVNANTPGWCLGGTPSYGADEGGFLGVMAIDIDANGNLVTGGADWYYGTALQTWNSTTGAFGGTLAFQSASPSQWSADANAKAQLEGYDDKSMSAPEGVYSDGTYLYVAEFSASRVKKVDLKSGATVGWVGAVATAPNAGSTACLGQNGMSYALGWCLGALFVPDWRTASLVPSNTDGTFYHPIGVTGDGTYLYVLDYDWHRIQKFKLSDGSYVGWIGRVSSTSGLGGGTGCSATASGNQTPTWCRGGTPQWGTGDGHLRNPTGITYNAGTLYVVDYGNSRVSSYDSATGAFKGWIGRVATAPASGCVTTTNANGYTISGSGWCLGGTSTNSGGDKGGGFSFNQAREGIATDGTYLYISNSAMSRIDKYTLNGQYTSSVSTDTFTYTNVWSNNPTTIANMAIGRSYPRGLWVDSTNIYAMVNQSYGNSVTVLQKIDMTTGNVIGNKGFFLPGNPASNNGEIGKTGCAGLRNAISSEWCQGGVLGYSLYLGGFWNANFVAGDANFVYVTDDSTHRLTRIPK